MRYRSFEILVLAVSAVAVLGTAGVSAMGGRFSLTEFLGQVFVLLVLAAAVHWGRNGGFIAAAVATVVYALLAVPQVSAGAGLRPETVQLVLVHVIVYGLVGVVGGEVCGRLKYQLARMDGSSALDADSRLYSERLVHGLITSGVARYRRYDTPFSVVLIALSPGLFAEYRPLKCRGIVRRIASHLRNDVRMVDDLGRLDDGRFVLMLPATSSTGAEIVAARVGLGVRQLMDAREDAVTSQVMATDRNAEELERFADTLLPTPIGIADEPVHESAAPMTGAVRVSEPRSGGLPGASSAGRTSG